MPALPKFNLHKMVTDCQSRAALHIFETGASFQSVCKQGLETMVTESLSPSWILK